MIGSCQICWEHVTHSFIILTSSWSSWTTHVKKVVWKPAFHSNLVWAAKMWWAWLNTLRPRQNGCHFADDTFHPIFVNENVRIAFKFSLEFVPKGPINNIPALVQIMAWCHPGNKPLSEPVMVSLLTHICVTRPQWVKVLYMVEQIHVGVAGSRVDIDDRHWSIRLCAHWSWLSVMSIPECMYHVIYLHRTCGLCEQAVLDLLMRSRFHNASCALWDGIICSQELIHYGNYLLISKCCKRTGHWKG